MKKNTVAKKIKENTAQKGAELKKGLPIKNTTSDPVKNTALNTSGLNQEKTSRDDLFPSDADNLTQ
ncbi:MAG: hypothetical protein QM737_16135 [Ferruginibacter sp.]